MPDAPTPHEYGIEERRSAVDGTTRWRAICHHPRCAWGASSYHATRTLADAMGRTHAAQAKAEALARYIREAVGWTPTGRRDDAFRERRGLLAAGVPDHSHTGGGKCECPFPGCGSSFWGGHEGGIVAHLLKPHTACPVCGRYLVNPRAGTHVRTHRGNNIEKVLADYADRP